MWQWLDGTGFWHLYNADTQHTFHLAAEHNIQSVVLFADGGHCTVANLKHSEHVDCATGFACKMRFMAGFALCMHFRSGAHVATSHAGKVQK